MMAETNFGHTREELIDLVNDGLDELGCTVDELWIAISRITNVKLQDIQKENARKENEQ
jgi:hypothetical protein